MEVVESSISIKDITLAMRETEHKSFLIASDKKGVLPRYSDKIRALYLIMHWPCIAAESFEIDKETGVSSFGMSLYAALMEHGKTHVAEVFFADEASSSYYGTHRVFSVEFPENIYDEEYDDWIMDQIASEVMGVKREKTIAHGIGN